MVSWCLWNLRIPVVVTEVSELSLIRISSYAKIHNLDPRTVIAAIVENRLAPPAFPLPYEGIPVSMKALEDRWLVSLCSVIKPRETAP